MKHLPIIFSTPMVQAILDDRKTQTRRVVKPQPIRSPYWTHYENSGAFYPATYDAEPSILRCPFGKPGDRLYVRETFGFDPWHYLEGHDSILYRACQKIDSDYPIKWKPSIYMPKKYARIWLEITNVRVERLQDITESDAEKEGVNQGIVRTQELISGRWVDYPYYKKGFKDLWDSINGKKHPWKANLWVWVLEFRKVTP